MRICLFAIVVAFYSSTIDWAAQADDWPRFRGPNGTGVNPQSRLPEEFGPETNVLWKIAAGQGSSSPIIVGDRLLFTSHQENTRSVHCLDASTGQSLWTFDLPKTHDEPGTPPHGPATSTPASDGQHVVVFFPDAGLVCLTIDGQHRWTSSVGPFHSMHGISSSPIILADKAIIVADQLSGSFIAAYDLHSGEESWKAERLDGLTGGYSTPSVLSISSQGEQIVASGPGEVIGYDPQSGNVIWTVAGVTNAPVSVPVVFEQQVFVCEPVGTAAPMSQLSQPFDKNKDGGISLEEVKDNIAISRMLQRLDNRWGDGDGVVVEAEWDEAFGGFVNKGGLVAIEFPGGQPGRSRVQWSYLKQVPYVSSPLAYQDALYFVQDGGILTSVSTKDGQVLHRGRLDNGRQYYASPVAADGKVLLVDTSGNMSVVRAGEQWELLDTVSFGERCDATPAIAQDRLYVRTQTTLYCFAEGQ